MTRNATTAARGRRRRTQEPRTLSGRTRVFAIVALAVVLLGAVGFVAVRDGWVTGGADGVALLPRADPDPEWQPAAGVFGDPAATGEGGADDTPIADVLAGPLADDGLGGRVGMVVIDVDTGGPVFAEGADTPQMPASTAKLLTATAALAELGPDHRFTTAVTATETLADGVELTLVGGGDPVLGTGDGSWVTSLDGLADATIEALTAAGVTSIRLAYDDGLFTGPAVDPDWSSSYVPEGIVSPTTALMIDGGRLDPEAGGDAGARADDPAATTAGAFADLLGAAGIEIDGDPARTAGTTDGSEPTEVAAVESAPLSTIVEHTLETSDDDAAETLMRHVALARDLPATSDDGSAAVLAAVGDLGVDVAGATLADGSGLSRDTRIPAAAVGGVLAIAASPDQPGLRAVVTGLPVAGFTGTLAERWTDGTPGAGVVRAKTGTLTGASSLAGVVETASGQTLAFAVLADDVTDTFAARLALDDVGGALSTCGCTVP